MFNEESKTCAREECGNRFVAKVYNAIYCSPECRKIVTNRNLLASYYEKKSNKNKVRECKTKNCTTILSRYNKENICERCKKERFVKRLVGWGWDEAELRKSLE